MEIKDLSVEEINQILQALAKEPFEKVNTLIAKIHGQGQSQLAPPDGAASGDSVEP